MFPHHQRPADFSIGHWHFWILADKAKKKNEQFDDGGEHEASKPEIQKQVLGKSSLKLDLIWVWYPLSLYVLFQMMFACFCGNDKSFFLEIQLAVGIV